MYNHSILPLLFATARGDRSSKKCCLKGNKLLSSTCGVMIRTWGRILLGDMGKDVLRLMLND